MKKITFIAGLVLISAVGYAQDFYKFSQRTTTYTDLVSPVSVNSNATWVYDEFGPFTSPFPVSIFGEDFTIFGFEDDNFVLANTTTSGDEFVYLAPISAYLQDRNISGSGNGLSPLSYKIDGTTGNRILKLEVKNAGLEIENDENATTNLFLNYQVWFYEADKSIEYHFGNHNITNMSMLNDEAFYWSIFLYEGSNGDNAGVVTGALSNPTYGEFTDPDQISTNLSAMPTPNTVYRFEVDPLAIKDQTKVSFNVYPNPTTDILNITVEENNNYEYVVYDAVGRFVSSGKLFSDNNVVNVSHLNNGIYYFKVGATVKKFIKK